MTDFMRFLCVDREHRSLREGVERVYFLIQFFLGLAKGQRRCRLRISRCDLLFVLGALCPITMIKKNSTGARLLTLP